VNTLKPRTDRLRPDVRWLASLGNVLYWLGCIIGWGIFLLAFTCCGPIGAFNSILFILMALATWLVGRTCRYVLVGLAKWLSADAKRVT
jgi:hypothetical protein